jgi:acyl dehydratase
MVQPGAVYASQSLRFTAPVYAGDEAVAEVRAVNIKSAGGRHMYHHLTPSLLFFLRPLQFFLML